MSPLNDLKMIENGICWSSIMINYDVGHTMVPKQQLARKSVINRLKMDNISILEPRANPSEIDAIKF